MPYKYDVFISYASEDRAWAEKLKKSLIGAGISVFQDTDQMKPGTPWEPVLMQGMKQSKHLIVLWSNYAANRSSWVAKETIWFEFADNNERRRINIILEDVVAPAENGLPQARIDKTIQDIETVKGKHVYDVLANDKGANAIDRKAWEELISQVISGVEAKDLRDPIYRLVLTVCNPDPQHEPACKVKYEDVRFDEPDRIDGKSLNEFLSPYGHSKETLRIRYGNTQAEWRPYGSQNNILKITDEILDHINEEYLLHYKWVAVDEVDFWSSDAGAQRQIKRIMQESAVIVIDPIALYHNSIKRKFDILKSQCFQNKNALIIAFSLFEPTPDFLLSQKIIEFADYDFHKSYNSPPIPKIKSNLLAQLAANPVDRTEAGRFIQYLISQTYTPKDNPAKENDAKAIFGN